MSVLPLLFISCTKHEIGRLVPVTLDAVLESEIKSSKAAISANPYKGTSAAGMQAAVWFSHTSGEYEDNPAAPNNIPFHAAVTYPVTGSVTVYKEPLNMKDPLTYPVEGTEIYCIGLYPATGWTQPDTKTVTRSLDGQTDLMHASQQQGSWQTPFATQSYKHLLSWIRVGYCALSHEAEDFWGKILKIEAIETPSTLSLDLGSGKASYSGTANHVIFEADTPMDINMSFAGDYLCAPNVNEGKAYVKLKVTTQIEGKAKRETIVEVPLKKENGVDDVTMADASGQMYIVTLYFSSSVVIEGSCILSPWTEQNEDLFGTVTNH